MFVPPLYSKLDLQDVIGLHVPQPLIVEYNEDNELLTRGGQHEADRKIRQIYTKIRRPTEYIGSFHSGPHKFDVAMQNQAFDWLERKLA